MLGLATVFGFVTGGTFSLFVNLRRTASLRRPPFGVLEDRVHGLARFSLPPGWRPASALNEGSALQAIDPLRSRYVLVISSSRENYEALMDLTEYSERTRATFVTWPRRVLGIRGPDQRRVDGFRALQYEIDVSADLTLMTFLHTTIEGQRAFHQVIAWAVRSTYDRQAFERLLDGFSEVPGPHPRPLAIETSPLAASAGRSVH